MLLLVLLGSTPRKYLHDLLATHTDRSYHIGGDVASFTQAGYNCGFQQHDAETPFELAYLFAMPAPARPFCAAQPAYCYIDPATGHTAGTDVRGPPVA